MQIGWQDGQSVVRDALRAERRDGPGGRLAVWHAGCVEQDGGRSGRCGVPYAAQRAGQGALGGRSPGQDESWDAPRVSNKISVRKKLRVSFLVQKKYFADRE